MEQLLQRLATSRLPMALTAPRDVDQVMRLRAAGLVMAFLPAPADLLALAGGSRAAQVLAITAKGREALRSDLPQAA